MLFGYFYKEVGKKDVYNFTRKPEKMVTKIILVTHKILPNPHSTPQFKNKIPI
jgi:hypothetical protein